MFGLVQSLLQFIEKHYKEKDIIKKKEYSRLFSVWIFFDEANYL